MDSRTWFQNKKWGVFTHYLHSIQNKSMVHTKGMPVTSWDECVNEFDAEAYAKTLHALNCGYAVFTLGQCDRFLCAPNETYNTITGYKTGEACSHRDLILDIIHALAQYDIPLFLYYTGDGPFMDEQAGKAMGFHDRMTEKINDVFIENWGRVLQEYSMRYGDKIKGWWIDGCYDFFGYTDSYLMRLKKFARAGNPDALMAFNNGVDLKDYWNPKYAPYYDKDDHPLTRIEKIEYAMRQGICDDTGYLCKKLENQYRAADDYTAGEKNEFAILPVIKNPVKQWHILSFLGNLTLQGPVNNPYSSNGSGWGAAGSRYSGEYIKDYVDKVNAMGGVVSIDMLLFRDGTFDMGQVEVIKALKNVRR